MTEPRMAGNVIRAGVTVLYASGFPLMGHRVDDACIECGCAVGRHEIVLPEGTSALDLLDRIGQVECPSCDASCGTWAVTLPGWA